MLKVICIYICVCIYVYIYTYTSIFQGVSFLSVEPKTYFLCAGGVFCWLRRSFQSVCLLKCFWKVQMTASKHQRAAQHVSLTSRNSVLSSLALQTKTSEINRTSTFEVRSIRCPKEKHV